MPAVRHLAALPPTYPVAFALAASATQASVREVLLAYAFGWAENMVQAALKSMQLGQSAGQRILARLAATPSRWPQTTPRPDGQRAPGVFAHAGHPERPARSAIFKTFSLLAQDTSASSYIYLIVAITHTMTTHCTTSPTAPKTCPPCA
jgi:hypothetical protein